MNLWVLGSGSRGNALVIESDDTRVLIDAGFAARTLVGKLRSVGLAPESISAVVVTHEHIDHVRGVAAGAARFGWRVHATAGTFASCPAIHDQRIAREVIPPGGTVTLGALELVTIRVSHDATEPIAIVATERRSGERLGIAYDLGCHTASLRAALSGVEVLVAESNHDAGMLRTGPYPPVLQRRISSARGHLSNDDGAELIASVAHRGLRQVVLAHLSEINNDPAIALATARTRLARTACSARISAASQDAVMQVAAPTRAMVSVQLQLGL